MVPVTTLCFQPGLALMAHRALQAMALALHRARAAWQRRQQTRATAQALAQLDDVALHDLALDRSELLSAASELHGRTARERRHRRSLAQRQR